VAQDAVDWAREIQHVPSLGIALMYQGIVHQYCGRKREVGEVSGELLELSRQYGLTVYAAYGALLHCWAKDDLTGGEEAFALLEAKSLHAVAFYYSLLSDVDHLQGRAAAALARIDRCLAICHSLDERYYQPHLHLRRAQYLLTDPANGRSRAREDLETAIRLASAQGAVQIVKLARGLLPRAG
jgi:ATP/maltotriose-dependent transcriptional regulator MalT